MGSINTSKGTGLWQRRLIRWTKCRWNSVREEICMFENQDVYLSVKLVLITSSSLQLSPELQTIWISLQGISQNIVTSQTQCSQYKPNSPSLNPTFRHTALSPFLKGPRHHKVITLDLDLKFTYGIDLGLCFNPSMHDSCAWPPFVNLAFHGLFFPCSHL